MRIGIDIRNIGKKRTGDEVVFFNLAKNLAQIDSKNEYVLCTDQTDPIVLEDITERLEIQNKTNFQIVSLQTKNRFTWNFWALQKYLRVTPVDIFLTQYITPFFIPKKIKIATIVHDVSFKVYPQYIKFSDLFFLNLLLPLSFRRADRIIGVSRFTAEEIIKYYKISPKKVDWIHNAASDNFQREISGEELAMVRKKYDLPEKFILYIGTLQPRKNLPTLIEAYAKLPSNIKAEIKLVIAGGKGHNYDKKIGTIIEKYNLKENIWMPGFITEEDKPVLFQLSHLFCNPSFYEGFGITILEAMTLGIPVAASDIAPHREVAEESILYFDPDNSDQLAEKLELLCLDNDWRATLSQKEKLQAKKFSWLNTAARSVDILQKQA